ncbi:hypothetical protein ACFOYW_13345 [Gryllotalpicola reticulitermitis]|uniref:MmpS family membrane protein n=1 Tax=Gryllotalpicola reticulitermitis TaxID=1184153 RepID=A0ABV8QAU3_9MICO
MPRFTLSSASRKRLRENWHLIAAAAVILCLPLVIVAGAPSGSGDATTTATEPAKAAATATQAKTRPTPTVTSYRISATSANGVALVLADDPKYKTRTPLKGIGGTSWEDVPASATGVSIQVISQTGDGARCTITAKQTGKVVATQTIAPAHGQGTQSVTCEMP